MSENGGSFDPWAVLGIPCDASRDTAHAAYRRLAMRYHPDRNPGDREAQALFLARGIEQLAEARDRLATHARDPR